MLSVHVERISSSSTSSLKPPAAVNVPSARKAKRQSYQAFSRKGAAAPLPAITAGNAGTSTSSLMTSGPAP
jgi:hypothetical protein